MLFSFPGKGCTGCPFYKTNFRDWHGCWLSDRLDRSGRTVRINMGRNLLIASGPPEDWPEGCPFRDSTITIQIVALENE